MAVGWSWWRRWGRRLWEVARGVGSLGGCCGVVVGVEDLVVVIVDVVVASMSFGVVVIVVVLLAGCVVRLSATS